MVGGRYSSVLWLDWFGGCLIAFTLVYTLVWWLLVCLIWGGLVWYGISWVCLWFDLIGCFPGFCLVL